MFRVVCVNVNGLRSAANKGLMAWLDQVSPDFVCIQEVKAQEPDLPDNLLAPAGWHAYFHCAQTRGYSGTAIYARRQPDAVIRGFGSPEFDAEGRYVEVRYGRFSLISAYFPSGSSSEERQEAKFRFLEVFLPHLRALVAAGRDVLLCGDVNIAHKAIDLKNWRSNQKNSGFLPEERAWLDQLFGVEAWVDVFRRLDERPDQYTWWSNRGRARENNVGWRIDYQIATPDLAQRARTCSIYVDQKFSDHAPLIIDYEGTV
jgi:exodeoxyribonuclease-3